MDVAVVPSAPTIYTHEEVATETGAAQYQFGLLHEFVNCWIRQRWLRRRDSVRTASLWHYLHLAGFQR